MEHAAGGTAADERTRAIAEMYDQSAPMSDAFNDGQVHLAYWFDAQDDATMTEASRRLTRKTADSLGLRPGMRVLDVGCGMGTPALQLAQEYGVDVVGINISPVQVEAARQRSAAAGLADRVTFQVTDFKDLAGFPDGAFDAVIAMEVLLYAEDLVGALRGLHRVLKPGGRLSLTETTRDNMTVAEAEEFAKTFQAEFLISVPEWIAALREAGFEFQESVQCGPRVFGMGAKYVADAEQRATELEAGFGAEAVAELKMALGYYFETGAGRVGYAIVTAGRPAEASAAAGRGGS